REPALVRRTDVRLHGREAGAAAAVPRTHRGPDDRRRRPAGVRPHPAGPGAAHPPEQGEVEHLHEPPAHGADGDDQRRRARPSGAARGRAGHRRAGARVAEAGYAPLTGTRFFAEFVLPVARPAEELRAALARRGVHAGVPVPAEYGLGDAVLLAATERVKDEDIDALVAALDAAGARRPQEVARG